MTNLRIELKGIFSPELNRPEVPEDPDCCAVLMFADIGGVEGDAADQFSFHVVTPRFLVLHPETRWGNGYLIMPEFSWKEIERMLNRLVAHVRASTWPQAANELGKYLAWEYEGYDD